MCTFCAPIPGADSQVHISEALALLILDWHGGGGSAVYEAGSWALSQGWITTDQAIRMLNELIDTFNSVDKQYPGRDELIALIFRFGSNDQVSAVIGQLQRERMLNDESGDYQ